MAFGFPACWVAAGRSCGFFIEVASIDTHLTLLPAARIKSAIRTPGY
jgi:hypothetical protein